MTLTAEQFQEIIASLRSDSSAGRHSEKRLGPRVGLRAKIVVAPMLEAAGLARWTSVWLRDLSTDGIGITHTEAIPPGTRLVARFPRRGLRPLEVIYVVAHCRPLAKQLHRIGARLERVIDDEALAAELSPPRAQRAG